MSYDGIATRTEATLLSEKAAEYLAKGPVDVVELIGHVCNLPGAPRVVAEHMAEAMFAGRPEFSVDLMGKWSLTAQRPVQPRAGTERLDSMPFVVVDLETTGGQPPFHRITEVAAVAVQGGRITDSFETLVNPERPIPPYVSRLTRITWNMVKRKPVFAEITPRLLNIIEGRVFVAHNAKFDWHFLSHEIQRASGAQIYGRNLCTAKMARRLVPQLPRRSLDYVANHYGIEIENRHRAGGDATATAQCLIRLLDDARDMGCETWQDLNDLMTRGRAKKKRKKSALPSPISRDTTA